MQSSILRYFFSLLLLLALSHHFAKAQILDDSTKQVYGSNTTLYFLEKDILENREGLRYMDTTLHAYHQFTFPQRHNNFYQDLGYNATALRPVFYRLPAQIGTRLGMDAYEAQIKNPQAYKYFDSKSPYTHAYYVQGTDGLQITHFKYTQNINASWNVGFEYNREVIDKPYGAVEFGERLADHLGFTAHTSYRSPNQKYTVLYHYYHLNLQMEETGGIRLDEADGIRDSLFVLDFAEVNLTDQADSWQTQNNHHLYQEFVLDKGFTLFHVGNYKRQRDTYNEDALNSNLNFYLNPSSFTRPEVDSVSNATVAQNTYFSTEKVDDSFVFRVLENKVGIKGQLAKFNYQLWFRNQIFDYKTSYEGKIFSTDTLRIDTLATGSSEPLLVYTIDSLRIGRDLSEIESFVGGKLFYTLSDSSRLTVEAELMLGRDYYLSGLWQSQVFSASFRSMLYSPTVVQRSFLSNITAFDWQKSYSNTLSNEFAGSARFEFGKLILRPNLSYNLINNYIYFNENARPAQSSRAVQLLKVGLNFQYKLWRIKTENNMIYTESLGEDLFRIPRVFINSRVFCEDCFLKKLIQTQLGVEMHYKSGYFADAYMPLTKQFHLQNTFKVRGYPVLDLFFNVRLKNFRLFLKLAHLNQANNEGYITTPAYPGMRRSIVFGIFWKFFD